MKSKMKKKRMEKKKNKKNEKKKKKSKHYVFDFGQYQLLSWPGRS